MTDTAPWPEIAFKFCLLTTRSDVLPLLVVNKILRRAVMCAVETV